MHCCDNITVEIAMDAICIWFGSLQAALPMHRYPDLAQRIWATKMSAIDGEYAHCWKTVQRPFQADVSTTLVRPGRAVGALMLKRKAHPMGDIVATRGRYLVQNLSVLDTRSTGELQGQEFV